VRPQQGEDNDEDDGKKRRDDYKCIKRYQPHFLRIVHVAPLAYVDYGVPLLLNNGFHRDGSLLKILKLSDINADINNEVTIKIILTAIAQLKDAAFTNWH